MKNLYEMKIIPILITAGALFIFFANAIFENPTGGRETEPVEVNEPVVSGSQSGIHEKVVYSCRLGNEEIPAVQISEVADASGEVTETIARVAGRNIEIRTPDGGPIWDFKAIAARAGDNVIEVEFDPGHGRGDYDWDLTLVDENRFFSARVRDCTEISDE